MKKLCLTLITLLAAFQFSDAQWTTNGNNINNTNTGNVGIGTTTPGATLDIVGNPTQLRLNNNAHTAAFTLDPSGDLTIGPVAELVDIKSGANTSLLIDANAEFGSAVTIRTGNAGSISNYSIESGVRSVNNLRFVDLQAGINVMTLASNDFVGIGTIHPQNKLDVNGTVHAKQVNVDLSGWSDYVFDKDYRLPTLAETETYINQNHHLAEIPSANEITKNGLDLGENE